MNFLESSSPKKFKISGNINFSIDVSSQGQLPFHTAIISISTHSKGNRKDVLGSNYKWFRFTDTATFHITDMVSNTYIISPTDIGYKLRVEITPKEEGFDGLGIVEFGPIKLDPSIRNTLEGILSVGGSSFVGSLINDNLNKMNSDVNILLTNDTIRIVRNHNQESLKFCYSVQTPQIEISSRDLNFLAFIFIEPLPESKFSKETVNGDKMNLKMASRISRDLLLLSIKCFAIRNYLINSKIINSIENEPNVDPLKFFKEKDTNKSLMGDIILELNLVKQENSMLLSQNKALKIEKDVYTVQIKNLEQEIVETIDTYTKLITDLKENGCESFNENLLEKTKNELFFKRKKTSEMIELENNDFTAIKKALFKEENENEIYELKNKNSNLLKEINSLKSELYNLKSQKSTNNSSNASLQDCLIKMDILNQENNSLKQTQQKYYELISKFRELDEKYNRLLNLKNENSNTGFKCESLERELAQEKELNKKLNDNIKLISLQFNNLKRSNSSSNTLETESLISINKQLNKKIECLQKELENKGNSMIIEQLTKTNTKFMLENQKLMDELKRKNDDISIYGGSRSSKELLNENLFLKQKIKDLEGERDKLLVDFSKINKF